ncbi:MAG: lysylphosphatidylglycerol synthase transmembrane domain-containing protein [Pyrinomonadaceae bacterium]
MSSPMPVKGKSKLARAGSVIFALLGFALFAYFIWKAGPRNIWENIRQLGAGFLLVLFISGVRPALRALAWTQCFEAPHTLRFRDAFRAYLAGDAMGNLTPLGMVVSEPAKAAQVRHRVPLVASLSAIAVENSFYMLSVAFFIFAGTVALMLSFPLSPRLRVTGYATLAGVAVVVTIAYFVLRRQWKFLSGTLEFFYGRGLARRFLETKRERARSLEERVYGFYGRNQKRFLPILLCDFGFHLATVAEIYATLYFINVPVTILSAFVLGSVERLITVIFKFIPMRVGVDEAGTGLITKALRFGTGVGVTLAIVRKARVVAWTAVGLALLVRQGLSLRDVANSEMPPEAVTLTDAATATRRRAAAGG